MRVLLGLVLLLAAMLPGVAMAQEATPATCSSGDVPSRVVPQEVEGGLVFQGEGDMVTEPFTVPAGDVIIAMDAAPNPDASDGEGFYSVDIHPVAGSPAKASPAQPIFAITTGYRGVVISSIDTDGEIFLEIHAHGPWTMELEF